MAWSGSYQSEAQKAKAGWVFWENGKPQAGAVLDKNNAGSKTPIKSRLQVGSTEGVENLGSAENRYAKGTKWGGVWKGCPFPVDYGSGERFELPKVVRGRTAEPRAETHFGVFWRPQTAFYTYMLWVRQTLVYVTLGARRKFGAAGQLPLSQRRTALYMSWNGNHPNAILLIKLCNLVGIVLGGDWIGQIRVPQKIFL